MALQFIYWAILIVSAVYAYTNRPKTPKQKPVAFEDIDFPQFEEGTPQIVFFGDCWTPDWMVLTVGNYRTRAIRTKGGK